MSSQEPPPSGAGDDAPDVRTKEEIQADLDSTREHLAETVDALGHKLDVKSRSREKIAEVKRDHGNEVAIGGAVVAVLVVALLVWRRRRR